MARKVSQKCLTCSGLEIQQVYELHGEQGDGCWDGRRCPQRRYHYRHRAEQISKRRAMSAAQRRSGVEVLSVPVQMPVVAYLVLYRKARQDAPVHALEVQIWQGSEQIAQTEPIHCVGMRPKEMYHYLEQVLKLLGERWGIRKFSEELILDPRECPIRPCLLRRGSDDPG